MSGITPCLWFDGKAEEAARFYTSLFPNSHVDAVHRAPSDYPSGKAGDVLLVEFTRSTVHRPEWWTAIPVQ
jgi:predicted 3-demethylubiquinone-9 3-methyltransferase (glyoxalase superfamily)